MDMYRALIGDPPTEEEKLMALAAQLRMRNQQGLLGQMSGDRILAPAGKGMIDDANTQAQQLGVRGETARYRRYQEDQSQQSLAQRKAEQLAQEKQFGMSHQVDLSRLGLERARLAQARELAGERLNSAEEVARIRAAKRGEGMKLSSKAMQDAQKAEKIADQSVTLREQMPNSAVDRGKDIAVDLTSAIRPSFGQLTGGFVYDDTENSWRAEADRYDQNLSNLAAGLAVTGYELENKQKWSPRAPGISRQQATARFEAIERDFRAASKYARGQNEAYINMYGTDSTVDSEESQLMERLRALEEQDAAL